MSGENSLFDDVSVTCIVDVSGVLLGTSMRERDDANSMASYQ